MGAHTHTQTAGCLNPSQDLALISPLSLFHSFLAHSLPFSSQIAAAFDVLQKTIAGASALFCVFNSSLALVESPLMIISFCISFSLFLVISHFKVYFYFSNVLLFKQQPTGIYDLWPFQKEPERGLFICAGTLPLLLSMLIEFLCSLIKRIEFASAAGLLYGQLGTHTLMDMHTHLQTHISALPRTLLSIPADSLLIARGLTGSGGVIASEF